jgi:hypothetical protein
MSKTELIILICIGLGLSTLILYSKDFGIGRIVRLILTFITVPVIIVYALLGSLMNENTVKYGFLSNPIVVGLFFELFDWLSFKIRGRGFYLHARGSSRIKWLGWPLEQGRFKWSDILFSVILVMLWMGWWIIFILISYFIQS